MFHCLRQKTTVDSYSLVYEPVWFKLGMMIETSKICLLILVFVTLALIQGHMDAMWCEMAHFFHLKDIWNTDLNKHRDYYENSIEDN